jgi:hypothetical protein
MSVSLYPWLKERDEKRKKKLFKKDVLVRVEETVLGASFNVQSQVTDIPGVSLYTSSSRYTPSLQTHSLTSDVQCVSLREYMEDLSSSFNNHHQVPDDTYVKDRRCSLFTFVDNPHKDNKCLQGYLRNKTPFTYFLELESQDSTQELFRLIISPYLGVSWIELQ